MKPSALLSSALLGELAELAGRADAEAMWPGPSWDVLSRTGALRWAIPKAYGGEELRALQRLQGYEGLASACLTTCFLLSQRDAACRRLADSGRNDLCAELFPPLASGERFMTVGLAQLTTSRQHIQPPVTARRSGDDWIIDGVIPWVTGASRAEHIVVGAVADEGQILAVLPTARPGVAVGPPLDLMALEGSLTAEVRCESVRLESKWLLAGPAEQVMRTGQSSGTGGLETSALALGLTQAALRHLEKEARGRPALQPEVDRFAEQLEKMRQEMYRLAEGAATPEGAAGLRARANTLVLQVTQAAVMVSKGTGFLRRHPAQRWARQALFFLVWSCPWPVAASTLSHLAAVGDQLCS